MFRFEAILINGIKTVVTVCCGDLNASFWGSKIFVYEVWGTALTANVWSA